MHTYWTIEEIGNREQTAPSTGDGKHLLHDVCPSHIRVIDETFQFSQETHHVTSEATASARHGLARRVCARAYRCFLQKKLDRCFVATLGGDDHSLARGDHSGVRQRRQDI